MVLRMNLLRRRPSCCQGGVAKIKDTRLKGPNSLGPESEGKAAEGVTTNGQGHMQGHLACTRATD
jgi:hypothetical protein